jgi:hypothetical protein
MPSFYSWEEVLESPDDFSFNSTIVASRDHHPPAGSLAWPNPNAPQGQGQMTVAVELWLPRPGTSDSNQTFAQWCWSTQIFQSLNMVSEVAFYRRGAGRGENNLGALVWQLVCQIEDPARRMLKFYPERYMARNFLVYHRVLWPMESDPIWHHWGVCSRHDLSFLGSLQQLVRSDGSQRPT